MTSCRGRRVLCQHGATGPNDGGSQVRTVRRPFDGNCDQAGELIGHHHPYPGKRLIAAVTVCRSVRDVVPAIRNVVVPTNTRGVSDIMAGSVVYRAFPAPALRPAS